MIGYHPASDRISYLMSSWEPKSSIDKLEKWMELYG